MTNGTLGGTEIGKSWEALTLDFSPTTLPDTADAAPTTTTRRLTDAYLCQFGDPLREELLLVRCRQCSKPILPQSFAEHSERCLLVVQRKPAAGQLPSPRLALNTRIPTARSSDKRPESGSKAVDSLLYSSQPPSAAIVPDEAESMEDEYNLLVDEPSAAGPTGSHRSVFRGLKLKRKRPGDVDFDSQCAVITVSGIPCTRPITCQVHSMLTKSLVQGRSDGLDSLLLKYQRRLQSKYFGDLSAGELSMGNFDQTVPAQADSDQHKLSHKTPHHHAVHHQAHNEIDPDIDIIVDKLLRNPPKPLAASTYRDVKHQTNLFRIKDFLLTVLNVQQRQQQQRLHLNSTSATAAAAASIPQPKSSSNKQAATAGASSTAATTAQQPVRKSRPRKTATDPTAAAATVQRQFGASSATTYPPNAPQTQQQQQPAPSTQPVAVTTSHTMDPRDLKFA